MGGIRLKTKVCPILDRRMVLCNQRSAEWTESYARPEDGQDTLHESGCGIFSLCHLGQFLTGRWMEPEALARFSLAHGGKDDTGTNRPALLRAMQETGLSREYGFTYVPRDLENGSEALWQHMQRGVALCNLRPGHIVALIAAARIAGKRAYLALDSYCESADPRVREHVLHVIRKTNILFPVTNASGVYCGKTTGYMAYWVDADCPRDYNRLDVSPEETACMTVKEEKHND